MGILRVIPTQVDDTDSLDHQPIDIISDIESISTLAPSSIASTPPASNINQSPLKRNRFLLIDRLENVQKKLLGVRRARRINNDQHLSILLEHTEEECEGNSVEFFRSNNETGFVKILNNFEDMKVWEKFMSYSEEEQQKYLDYIDRRFRKGNIHYAQKEPDSEDGKTVDYSPRQRINFMSPNICEKLLKQQFALHELRTLEEELVDRFRANPTSVYVSSDLSSFSRLLLHELCQYYRLSSKSLDMEGLKKVQIVNKKVNFTIPEMTLSRYLMERNRST